MMLAASFKHNHEQERGTPELAAAGATYSPVRKSSAQLFNADPVSPDLAAMLRASYSPEGKPPESLKLDDLLLPNGDVVEGVAELLGKDVDNDFNTDNLHAMSLLDTDDTLQEEDLEQTTTCVIDTTIVEDEDSWHEDNEDEDNEDDYGSTAYGGRV
jgi:hypothetical protein